MILFQQIRKKQLNFVNCSQMERFLIVSFFYNFESGPKWTIARKWIDRPSDLAHNFKSNHLFLFRREKSNRNTCRRKSAKTEIIHSSNYSNHCMVWRNFKACFQIDAFNSNGTIRAVVFQRQNACRENAIFGRFICFVSSLLTH